MTILVQREFTVLMRDRARFEELSRTGTWPTMLRYGSLMVGFGSWVFGGRGDVLVTHSAYRDMEHWLGTRPGGYLNADPEIRAQAADFSTSARERNSIIQHSRARMLELEDRLTPQLPAPRTPRDPLAVPAPTFGLGSVISELSYHLISAGARSDFEQISQQLIWPWLESQGARMIAFGHDPLGSPTEVFTLFAFPGLVEWHQIARPAAAAHPPDEVVRAWNERQRLVTGQQGRLLRVATDWGPETP